MERDIFTETPALDLGHELIIDNFAGGGGTSTGLEAAFRRPVDIAINHDPEALAMHALNHPKTLHLCESVWEVDPIQITGNRPVALVWLSPDCKHFSKAKGGTPVDKNIRGLAWVGVRWAALTKPRVIAMENVSEIETWGPLIKGADGKAYPDQTKKGKFFQSFVRQLRAHGYVIEEIPDPAILFRDGVQAADPLSIPRIPLTATAQVRMCGNSVSPLQAEALIRSNFAHERLIYGRQAA